MPNYTEEKNESGKLIEVRFKPSFRIQGRCFGNLGPDMLKYGDFKFNNWRWSAITGEMELVSYALSEVLYIDNVQAEVERIDQMINDLMAEFVRWIEFDKIRRKIAENEPK